MPCRRSRAVDGDPQDRQRREHVSWSARLRRQAAPQIRASWSGHPAAGSAKYIGLEGTYATLDELLEADYVDEANRRAEVREVLNYVQAAEIALRMIEHKPICLNVIAPLQKILVRGTRGSNYDSGQLRDTNVYIGERGVGMEAARFVPPAGDELLGVRLGEVDYRG